MSWSLYANDVTAKDVTEKLRAAAALQLEQQPFDSWDDDVAAQMDSAFASAEVLAVGVSEGEDFILNVTASGHARRSPTDYVSLAVSFNSVARPKPAKTEKKKEG